MSDPRSTASRRELAFEACFNVRDLGGYVGDGGRSTSWQTLYRGDSLHRLTDRDLETIGALGLRTVLDLRTQAEVVKFGTFRADVHHVAFHHEPLVDILEASPDPRHAPPPADRGRRYADLAAAGGRSIARGLEVLSQPDALPAAFHCSAGRDRTGIFAAVLLSLLGVGDEDIVADYVLSQNSREASDRWAYANDPELVAVWEKHPSDLRNTWPETMTSFLATMRSRHGSVPAFAGAMGVTPEVVERLRDRLLEP